MQLVGVDTGGTFTDTVIVTSDGQVGVGKTLSSRTEPGQAVLRSIGAAAAQLGLDLTEALASTDVFSHGTTIGLNALLTGDGARTGLLTTEGFQATLPIAKINKVHGLDEVDRLEPTRWNKPTLLLPRRRILGIQERVDSRGNVLTPLDENQARQAIRRLGDDGVTAIAVCLLWSPLYPAHERRLAELIGDELGDRVHVSLSSDLAPRIGEYERTMTTVLTATLGPLVSRYVHDLSRALREAGFRGSFLLMQSGGGVAPALRLANRPLETLNSGPVGGLAAAMKVGERLGHRNVITTDVGGTSFDVGLVIDGAVQYLRRPMLDRHALANPIVDIMSIGTGGGSIAWVDSHLGALRVGPRSAGSDPGPACYARGGKAPTLTDAAVALGYLDKLGGQLELDREAAVAAIRSHVAEPLGLKVEEAAEGILRIANAQMADLVRRATVRRGHDPRDFALYAFGGAAAQYAGGYAEDLGCPEVVIPDLASTFSAYGAVASDLRAYAEREVAPIPLEGPLDQIRDILAQLGADVCEDLGGEPVLTRRAGIRFRRQVHELQIDLPAGELDGMAIAEKFRRAYEKVIGVGTAYANAPVEVVSLAVDGRRVLGAATPAGAAPTGPAAPTRYRQAWFNGVSGDHPVYLRHTLAAGSEVTGPAFIELPTTTIVVYPGQRALIDTDVRLLMEV
jgi:N-methylhydantoinase A